MPTVVIIAGPNGAGKSTIAPEVLRDTLSISTFVNADTIAAGLSGFSPEATATKAARLAWERLRELGSNGEDFAFETTLATRSFAPWLRELKQAGYEVVLIYVWLRGPELAIERVAHRKRLGGHTIPGDVVRRRYFRGLGNLFELYFPIADRWRVYDNSHQSSAKIVAWGGSDRDTVVVDRSEWARLMEVSKNGDD